MLFVNNLAQNGNQALRPLYCRSCLAAPKSTSMLIQDGIA